MILLDGISWMFRRRPTPRQLAAIQRSGTRECCKRAANLRCRVPMKGRAINTCRVCGNNHYWMQA